MADVANTQIAARTLIASATLLAGANLLAIAALFASETRAPSPARTAPPAVEGQRSIADLSMLAARPLFDPRRRSLHPRHRLHCRCSRASGSRRHIASIDLQHSYNVAESCQ